MFKWIPYSFLILLPVINPSGIDHALSPSRALSEWVSMQDLTIKGLSAEVCRLAIQGYDRLCSEGKLIHPEILTIIDFSQSSRNKRLYVIDLLEKKLIFNTFVTHGRNTGDEFARNFSNTSGSYQSSLGFYITQEKITGSKVGLALSLEGVEKGINDNAISREIIMHGADYATEDFIRRTGRLGRSFGCPALPPDMIKPVVDVIKGGTCLFIYYPDNYYLMNSALLKTDADPETCF